MTALNCKVGDLAIVIRSQVPENIGQIVEVLGPQDGRPFTLPWPGHCWRVRAVSRRRTLTYHFTFPKVGSVPRKERRCYGPVPDAFLRPVSGLVDPQQVSEDLGATAEDGSIARRVLAEIDA